MSSRILARNKRGLSFVVGGDVVESPPLLDPTRPEWVWPNHVNNPFKYGWYIRRLHKSRGLSMALPVGAYMRFAGANWGLGAEFLCRAAQLAALRANHPFSPIFIKKQFPEIPQKPKPIQLF